MPYCGTSYDTTAGQVQKLDKLSQALKEALVTGVLQNRRLGVLKNGQTSAVFVIGGSADEMHIPAFTHPYLIQKFKDQNFLITDMRAFRSNSQEYISDSEFESGVRNKVEYALTKSRAILGLEWLDPANVPAIRARFAFAGAVFANWISQAVSKSYALDLQDQMYLQAAALYYYHCLFTTEKKLTGEALEVAVIHTIKTTKLQASSVYSLFESFGDVSSVDDLCLLARKATESSVRLQSFDRAMLMTLIGNTWYGTNSKEMLAVALEHPPTWICIVYSTLVERTYKSSALYRIIELQAKRGEGDLFRMNFLEMFKTRVMAMESISEELVVKDFED